MFTGFDEALHNPVTLASEMVRLPADYVVVGSIGRCLVDGSLKDLRRANNTPSDIDVIDLSGTTSALSVFSNGSFRVDAGMTGILRPIAQKEGQLSWGLFDPGQTEPLFDLGSHELLQPVETIIPWVEQKPRIRMMGALVQAELVDITGPYIKDLKHAAAFRRRVQDTHTELPPKISRQFDQYRQYQRTFRHMRNLWHDDRGSRSSSECVYRQARHVFKVWVPPQAQQVVEQTIGNSVRAIRGTNESRP